MAQGLFHKKGHRQTRESGISHYGPITGSKEVKPKCSGPKCSGPKCPKPSKSFVFCCESALSTIGINGLPSQLRIFPRALSPAFFLNLRLLFFAVLESGAPLSSSLEEAL